MKKKLKTWKIILIISIIALIGVGAFFGVNYFEYSGDVAKSDAILTGQISNSQLFLTEDNTVRDYKNKIYATDISFISEDGLMVDTSGTLVGFSHIKRVKDVKLGYYVDNNDKLFRYDNETKRYICDEVKFIQSIKINGISEASIVVVTNKGEIMLQTEREDTEWFDLYLDSLSFGQKHHIAKITIDYIDTKYSSKAVVIHTLFENGILQKTVLNRYGYDDEEWRLTSEEVNQDYLVKDYIYDFVEFYDEYNVSHKYSFYVLTSDNKVYCKSNKEDNDYYKDGQYIDGWTDVKGIYIANNTLFAIKEDNTIYSSDETINNRINLFDVKEFIYLDYMIAVYEDNTYQLVDYPDYTSKYNEFLSKKYLDYAVNKSTFEYVYINEDNTGWYYNGEELKQIEGEFSKAFYYQNYFYFITLDGKIVSTYRFSNTEITSLENVSNFEADLILYNDGTVSTLNSSASFKNYLMNLSDIKEIGYDESSRSYWFKNSNGRLFLYSLENGDIEKLVSFPNDNDWDFVFAKYNKKLICFYSKSQDKNIVIEYDNQTKNYVIKTLENKFKIIQSVNVDYYIDHFLTTSGQLLVFYDYTYEEDQYEIFGIKILEK